MLHLREIDIAPQDFIVTKDRASVVDYLPGVTPSNTQIYIKNPDLLPNWAAYVAPLRPSCWVAILALLLITPVVVAGISFCGKYVNDAKNN